MTASLTCLATFTAKKDCEKKLKEALTALVEPTRQEAGCISYTLHQGSENPLLFAVIEHYKDKAAFDFHSEQPYLLKLKDILPELVDDLAINTYINCA